MGRVAIRTCDFCAEWDAPDARVLKVTVVGPRHDMCPAHRVALLTQMGMSEEDAMQYVKMQDERANERRTAGIAEDPTEVDVSDD